MKIRLTEQELHQIVKESVETILSEQTQPDNSIRAMVRESIRQYLKEWEQEYNQAQDKYDFEHDNEEYNKLPWLRRMGRKLTGRKPKDPFPDQTKEQLASKYVQKFNREHGFTHRYDDETASQGKMQYDRGTGLPYFKRTHRASPEFGMVLHGNTYQYDDEGNETDLGITYPDSEAGVSGWPQTSEPYAGRAAEDLPQINNARQNIQQVLRNRHQNKKKK